jgi:hypothetical protein
MGSKYYRPEWHKIEVDANAPCRACRARAAVRAHYLKQKEKEARRKQDEITRRQELGLEITPDLLPRVRIVMGNDPVVQACTQTLALLRKQLRKAEQEELMTPRHESKEGVAAGRRHPFHVWRERLLQARITLFEAVREQRKIDLQHPSVAVDPAKMSVRAYITEDDMRVLDYAAERTNYYSPVKRGRRWTGMPNIRIARPDALAANDGSNLTRGDVIMSKAWAPFVYAIEQAKRSSNTMLRRFAMHPPHKARRFTTTRDDGTELHFTMEDYHLKRIEAARQARRQIDSAITACLHPTEYHGMSKDGRLRDWGPLVPSLLASELRAMWHVLPEDKQQRLRPYKMQFKQNRFQRAHRLDENNVPLSDMLAVDDD